ncbi:phosphodiester glycosidase family protein [Streptomyces sp. GSL17-111]|uniref:phosphodiester glycosidase family protein n=1 Tax=Streptomyces sp. GSL17-111 TaxID=3121596 RepID=UPI0030F3916C
MTLHRRTARALLCAAASLLLGSALAVPTTTTDRPATAPAAAVPALPRAADGADPGRAPARSERPVAPGVTLTSFSEPRAGEWVRGDGLSVDLTGELRVDYLDSGEVTRRQTVSALVAHHDPGAGRRTVAAVNADFFDINGTGAPLSAGLRDGGLTQSGGPGPSRVAGFGPQGAGRILELLFEGSVRLPRGTRPLAGYNAAELPRDGIGLYTPGWGRADRAPTTHGARAAEVTVADGVVVAAHDESGTAPVPAGTTVLRGREAGADALAALAPGHRVAVRYAVRAGDGGPLPRTAVGGREPLVVDGEPRDWTGLPNNAPAPRTAVGLTADGGTLHLLTVDGRQAASGGVTLTALGRMMRDLGAYQALNLDGGGSATLLAREPGAARPRVENAPSDGAERPVPNGLAVTAPQGSGRPAGYWVRPALEPERTPGVPLGSGGRTDRVFPGLTRRLSAVPFDEAYGPATGTPRWSSARPALGTVDADGTFRAHRTGRVTVTAASVHPGTGLVRGGTRLEVLGPLERLRPTTARVALTAEGDSATFGLVGQDADGALALIAPEDVTPFYDARLFDVTPDRADGTFTVTARTGAASGRVELSVAGRTTTVAVTTGLTDRTVADFSDAGNWRFSGARATGAVVPEPAGRTGPGLRMRYDFSRSPATRAAYAEPPVPIPVPGRARHFTLWLYGDGHGAWPSLHLTDARGAGHVLRGPHVEWTGWRRLTFEVPPRAAHPLAVRRIYLAETRRGARYRGEVVLDDLVAGVPPESAADAAGARPRGAAGLRSGRSGGAPHGPRVGGRSARTGVSAPGRRCPCPAGPPRRPLPLSASWRRSGW